MVPECCVCHASFDVGCDVIECGMLVCVNLSVNVCMFTAIVRAGGMESTHPSRTDVVDQGFYVVESVVRGNADSLLN